MTRPLTPEDLPQVADVYARVWEAKKMPGKFDRERWLAWIANLWGSADILILGEVQEGRVLAAMGGILFQDHQTGLLMAQQIFLGADPESPGHGLKLVREFERAAFAAGADQVLVIHTYQDRPEACAAAFKRMGFRPTETVFVKERKCHKQ